MYIVLDEKGKLHGPYLSLDKAMEERTYSGGHIYLLKGPM